MQIQLIQNKYYNQRIRDNENQSKLSRIQQMRANLTKLMTKKPLVLSQLGKFNWRIGITKTQFI
ncbi:hypothetical protein pb186bvf_011875 [Paramecium bursaria]